MPHLVLLNESDYEFCRNSLVADYGEIEQAAFETAWQEGQEATVDVQRLLAATLMASFRAGLVTPEGRLGVSKENAGAYVAAVFDLIPNHVVEEAGIAFAAAFKMAKKGAKLLPGSSKRVDLRTAFTEFNGIGDVLVKHGVKNPQLVRLMDAFGIPHPPAPEPALSPLPAAGQLPESTHAEHRQ